MLKIIKGPFQFGFIKIRPEDRGEIQLCIGCLKNKIVAQPLLTAGPDDQVGIRLIAGV